MSRPVRIRADVAVRVGAVAAGERRSFANMVEVLLEAALAERGGSVASGGSVRRAPDGVTDRPRSVSAGSVADVRVGARQLASRNGGCRADVAFGSKCKLCGKVH